MADGGIHHARACQHPRLVGRIDDAVIIDDDIIDAHRVGVAQIDMAVSAGLEDPAQTDRQIRFLEHMRAIGPVSLDPPVHEALIIRPPPIILFAAAATALVRAAFTFAGPHDYTVTPPRGTAA